MGWGGMAGSPMGSGSAVSQSAAAGLPFAGIPEELAEKAQAILDAEPAHPEPDEVYSARAQDDRPLTLRRFLAPHRWGLTGALALVVIETVAAQAGPLLTQIGIDRGIGRQDRGILVAVGIAYLAAVLVSVGAGSVRVAWTGRLGERLTYRMRVRVFAHLQRLSLDFYTEEKAGRLMSRMTSDIDALTALFQEGLVNLAVQGLTLVVIGTVLIVLNPVLAAITLLAVLPVMTAMTLWFRSASDRGYEAVRDRIADVLADLQESLAGIRLVTAHNRRRHNAVAHDNIVGDYKDANLFTARIGAVYGPGTEAVGIGAQALILLVGGLLVRDGQVSVGELTAFVLYVTAFFAPIQALVQLYTTYQQGQAAMGKLRELLATQPAVVEAADARVLPGVSGTIELSAVEFGYGDGPPVLDGLDLRIEAGETFALVGPTGAGKSTIAKLITRFYDPRSGSVCIDGFDLRTVTERSLRSQLGVAVLIAVPTEPLGVLFAVLLLAAVVATASRWHVAPTDRNGFIAGTISGFSGTTVGVGGPPVAIVYQHDAGPVLRANLSRYFLAGLAISLTSLTIGGELGAHRIREGLVLVPGLLIGAALSGRAAVVLDRGWARPAVLVVSAASAVAVLVRAVA